MATAKTAAKKTENLVEDAQKAAGEQMEKMNKSFEDMAAFSQENMDALVKSSSLAVKAAEELNAEIASFSKKSVEDGVAAAKELSSVKSIPEFVEKQVEFSKTAFEGMMEQATRFNEMYMAAAKDVFEPLNARANAAGDMVKTFRV